MASLRSHDDLDTRREVILLLNRLSPAHRVQFLEWCCRNAEPNPAACPQVAEVTYQLRSQAVFDAAAAIRLNNDVYLSLWTLISQYHLDGQAALRHLESMARSSAWIS